jgi:acetyltransferase
MVSGDGIFDELQRPSIALMGIIDGVKASPEDSIGHARDALKALFKPRSIAVIGASEREGSTGRMLLDHLQGYKGEVYAINPNRREILGKPSLASLTELHRPVDLALIATPALSVPTVLQACIAARTRSAIIVSSVNDASLIKQIGDILQTAPQLRLIGPGSLGVMNTRRELNATVAACVALTGNVAFISQSNAIATSVLDWSFRENVGFSYFISVGAMLDVSLGPLIDYLGDDPNTDSIIIYMETLGNDRNNVRAFMSAAREVALSKPIIVLKAGRTREASQAAASHTDTLTNSDDALDAVFQRCGVLRVNAVSDLFYMAEVLGKQPRPKGPRLTIVTNAGGPGVLATDALITNGGVLAPVSAETQMVLDQMMPSHWSHANPIDILGNATPERFRAAIKSAVNNPDSDGTLVILSPQARIDPAEVARTLLPFAKGNKPILASWMGGSGVAAGEHILNQARIPTFGYPDTAARMFAYMWRYSENLRGLYETPMSLLGLGQPKLDFSGKSNFLSDQLDEVNIEPAGVTNSLIEAARAQGRTLLTEHESKQILAAYGIPVVPTQVATTEDEAITIAQQIGYPVVLKLHSHLITHKNDIGGVELNLRSDEGVRRAFHAIRQNVLESVVEKEGLTTLNPHPSSTSAFLGVTVQAMIPRRGYDLILGSSTDPQVGPLILFGTGGQLVEVLKDSALGLPPLNSTLARRLMEQTRIYDALRGAPSARGRAPIDLDALAQLLVHFSQLIVEQRWLKEVVINPLLVVPKMSSLLKNDVAHDGSILALDARMVLHDPATRTADLPRLAIQPYPTRYSQNITLRDGTPIVIRPIRAEDEPRIVDFHQTVSADSIYLRFFHHIPLEERIRHERLTRICYIDYDREMALVAVRDDGAIIGVGRLVKVDPALSGGDAEFALLLSDSVQRRGLGAELLRRLVRVGHDWGCARVVADILPDNFGMINVSRKVGFTIRHDYTEEVVKAELVLG